MKFLFVMSHPGYVRNNEPTLRALAERGHSITLGFNKALRDESDRLAEELVAAHPTMNYRAMPNRRDAWAPVAALVRGCMDYLRYFDPDYDNADALRKRIEERLPRFVRATFENLKLRKHAARRRLMHRSLAAIERAIPTDPQIDQVLVREGPDALIVTPLVNFNSSQTDWVKSAKARGIPTCLAVFSWDNLTNKGHIRIVPDRLTVWNPLQAEEAIRYHGVEKEKIRVTGAQCFDKWFDRSPSLDREAFLAPTGLDPSAPYILYLCSSPFVGGAAEAEFVTDWLSALRRSANVDVRNVAVMIRPHPQNAQIWKGVDLSDLGPVSLFPAAGSNPVDKRRQDEYFHSIFFSCAVVGINTSAMVESGIIGRPVITVRDSRFAARQEGTLHFHHLVRCRLLHIADNIEASTSLVDAALKGELFDQADSDEFIAAFIRPHGRDLPATPFCVEAFEEVGALDVAPERARLLSSAAIRAAIWPMLHPMGLLTGERKKRKVQKAETD
jgi:hypothetical protein